MRTCSATLDRLERREVLVFGNSGSGKSTYAGALAERHALAHLDPGTIVREHGQIAVQRSHEAIAASLDPSSQRTPAG